MKLDYKKTIKVGFAFAIVMVFWTAYDFVVPLLLENAFGLSNAMRGLIMGLDNLLSLFLLPLFGNLSDKTNSKYGKRTPYIFIGTIVSVVLMIFVPISAQKSLNEATAYRTNYIENMTDSEMTELLGGFYDKAVAGDSKYCDISYLNKNNVTKEQYVSFRQTDISKKGDVYYNGETVITEIEYNALKEQNDNYKKFVASGVNTFLSEQVHENLTKPNYSRLIVYMVILLFVLIAMATFRSPAVALMPDVTPKPLRSQANAIINLAGGVGGAIAFIIYTAGFMISSTNAYMGIFCCVAGSMLLLLVGYLCFVKEPKFKAECEEICKEYGITDDDIENLEEEELAKNNIVDDENHRKLKKAKNISFILILASIFMWFMGYNAISSNLSVYCTKVLNLNASVASVISGVSMGISAIAFIPVGFLAVKIGRRKSIILGFALATASFVLLWLFVKPSNIAQYLFSIFYLLAGFGLIIANVNTFPMVVELSDEKTVGKYTGFYYTATMSAQAITPFLGGLVMDHINERALFAYSALCVILAIVLMFFVKHGDSKVIPPKTKLEMLGGDD